MFSRLLLIVISCFVGLAACNLKLNESPPPEKQFELGDFDSTQCLAEVLPIMSGFVAGNASPNDVEKTWDCFAKAFEVYSIYVKGKSDNVYTSREIANFFETYFLKDLKISNVLLDEVMRLKQIFVGGDNQTVTKEELGKLIVFSKDIKRLSLEILPYMKVFSFHWKISHTEDLDKDINYFEDANGTIRNVVVELASIIEKNNKSYVIDNMVVLLEEIAKLYGENWAFLADLKKALPLVYKLKKTLAGGDEKSIASNEWRSFALLTARGYVQYLRYYYFIKTNDELGSGPELIYLAKSFNDLFSYLGDMVSTKPQGVLTRSELLEVIGALTQFFPQLQIKDSFLIELMKIKILIFGGDIDKFTPEDFKKAQGKVDAFKTLTEKFLDYIDVYSLQWNPSMKNYSDSQIYFKKAENNLNDLAKDLANLIESSYNLNDLLNLIHEYEEIYPIVIGGTEFSIIENVKKYLPLISVSHQIIFSIKKSVITKEQWPIFLGYISQIFSRGTFYYYFLNSPKTKIDHGLGLDSFGKIVTDSLAITDSLIKQKQFKIISYQEIKRVTDALLTAGIVPAEIGPEILDGLVKMLLSEVLLPPSDRISGKLPNGLTIKATQVFKEEFSLWEESQIFFEKLYKKLPPGQSELSAQKILEALSVLKNSPLAFELIKIYQSPQSRTTDSLGRLIINGENNTYSLSSTDRVNLSRTLARIVIRSYAGDLQRVEKYQGISLSEANKLYDDLKPLLVSLDLVDASNINFANSRFREANLFLPRSFGDSWADFNELSDLVMHIISGLKLNSLVTEKLKNPNPQLGCPIVKSGAEQGRVSVKCLTELFHRELENIFSSMPELTAMMLKLPRCQVNLETSANDILVEFMACGPSFDGMLYNIFKAAGYVVNKESLISLEAMSLSPHVMQYIESVMQRYDKDKNGILSNEEALESYPVFKDVLSKVSGKTDNNTLRGLLAWIMQYGRPPQTWQEKIKFMLSYRYRPEDWEINADREKLASILGFIADSLNGRTVPLQLQIVGP